MQVSARQLAQFRAVFGDCVPKENAATLLESSPAAPTAHEELDALRKALALVAGTKLPAPVPAPTVAGARTSPATLQRTSTQAARELRTPDGLLKVLTEKRAAQLYDEIAAMRDIPHDFVDEGCMHRAYVIGKRLEERGIFSEKILTIPRGGDLVLETPMAKLGFTVLWYHEAVVVHVQTSDGLERRVLDPSVGPRPLSVDAWLSTMRGSTGAPLETFYLPRFAYGLHARNAPPTSWNAADLESAAQWSIDWKACADELEKFGFYDELPHLARGETPPVKVRN